jgi:hypothetical protein
LKKFEPQDATSNLEFMQALMHIKMNPKDNPDILFTQISTLQNRFGVYSTEEQQLIANNSSALTRTHFQQNIKLLSLPNADNKRVLSRLTTWKIVWKITIAKYTALSLRRRSP